MNTLASLLIISALSAALAGFSVHIDWLLLPSTGVWIESNLPPQASPSTARVHVLPISVEGHLATARLLTERSGEPEAYDFPVSVPVPAINKRSLEFLTSLFFFNVVDGFALTDDTAWSVLALYPPPLKPAPLIEYDRRRLEFQQAQRLNTARDVAYEFVRARMNGEGLLSRTWLTSRQPKGVDKIHPPTSLELHTFRFRFASRSGSSYAPYTFHLPHDGRGILWTRESGGGEVDSPRVTQAECDVFKLPILPPSALTWLTWDQSQFRSSFLGQRLVDTFLWRTCAVALAICLLRYWRPLLRVSRRSVRSAADGLKALDDLDQRVRK